jgi:hypothetical protein
LGICRNLRQGCAPACADLLIRKEREKVKLINTKWMNCERMKIYFFFSSHGRRAKTKESLVETRGARDNAQM